MPGTVLAFHTPNLIQFLPQPCLVAIDNVYFIGEETYSEALNDFSRGAHLEKKS